MHSLRDSQQEAHLWGKRNRVLFDPSKEHFCVIHSSDGEGEPFKLLGCLIDCKLIMNQAIEKILAQVRPKVAAILRTRRYYNTADLIDQFKTHVWGLMEFQNGAIFHASDYLLSKLDCVHANFLMELGVEQSDAFMNFNFAPPDLRRNIGILGMIHKRVLGRCHPVFQKLLPFKSEWTANMLSESTINSFGIIPVRCNFNMLYSLSLSSAWWPLITDCHRTWSTTTP